MVVKLNPSFLGRVFYFKCILKRFIFTKILLKMSFGERFIPLAGVNLDLSPSKMVSDKARFIKNLVYSLGDSSDAGKSRGGDTGVFKTFQSNKPYIDGFTLPDGDNYCIGALSSKETKQVFVWIYNSRKAHTLYVLNGENQTMNIVYQGSNLNFQLNPENFIHLGAASVFILYITDPDTGLKKRKTFLSWVDNYNPNRFLCVEDAIATGGFNSNLVSYFDGDYSKDNFINAGVTPDQQCISIEEVPVTDDSQQKNNNLLFNTWQFRTRWVDVWGRPSDWSIISDLYIPGINDCLSSSTNIARCLNLSFSTPPPNIDKLEIAYRNCNDLQWYKSDTLELFNGSNLGNWWSRTRNPDINYNSDGSRIIYTFCADHECAPISPSETTRLFNPIPNNSLVCAPIGKTLAYSNNTYGFNPTPKDVLDKIKIEVKPPDTVAQELEARNIEILVPIFNQFKNNYQMVRPEGTAGYVWGDNNSGHGGAKAYMQYFSNPDQSGFCGYLVGGPSAISTQVYVAANGELVDDPTFNGLVLSSLRYNNGGVVFQKFVFSNIPPGQYIFRLSSHLSNPDTDVNYRKTSTTVFGVYPLSSGQLIPSNYNVVPTRQELFIDVCNGDYNTVGSGEMLVIADLAAYHGDIFASGRMRTLAAFGYLYESATEEVPMELVKLNEFSKPGFTDHNGFYWGAIFAIMAVNGLPVNFLFLNKCVPSSAKKDARSDNVIVQNFYVDGLNGSQFSDFSITPCNRTIITGRLLVQGTNIGIPGVDVALTRGASSTTDSNGYFSIIAHDDMVSTPRRDKLVITNGSCRYYTEGQICITPIDIEIYRCTTCSSERKKDIGTIRLLSAFLQRGLLSGGTYAVGVAGKGLIDRSQFVQDLGYINIPTVQETKVFAPSIIQVSIDPTVVFPQGIDRLVFSISEETTISDYVTWIVDDFEFVDNTGNENNSNPTQIKIYYGSLIEYNKQNNYNTTVNWGFIPESTPGQPVTTDNVTFLVNGDGKFFDKSITARVKYAADGEYFLINYTEDLKNLKKNAFIRLFRPKECVTSEVMYEICYSIPLKDGKATVEKFTLNAFDTYYINREIPVPVPQQDDPDATVLETRIFAYPFEHNSPSDFWGKACKNTGRINVKNEFEAVVYNIDEIALSGSFSENGYINYLSYFEDGYSATGVASRKFSFDKSNFLGIVSLIPQIGVVMIIGQYNNATVGFNDNLLRATGNGITVPSAADTFGQPNINPLANYGCLVFDKNSIAEYNGMVQWLDSVNTGVIQHNYSQAINISELSADAYTRSKIKDVALYNLNNENKRYFLGVANPINQEYLLSDKIIGDASYFNDKRDKEVSVQETVAYDIYFKMLKDWRSYTPEYYSSLKGEVNDQQLFSFKNGVPYFHYTAITDNNSWGEFYGMPAERIIEIIVNMDDIKKKKSLYTSSYSHHLYFVDRILTETNQESWIPIEYWKQGDYFWSAPILCDLNTPADPNVSIQTGANKLTDGNMLYGLWFKIRYVGVSEDNTKYTELTGFTVDVIPEEKSGK